MLFAADKGDINTIIGGIAPDWGPFGALGTEAKTMIQVVMAVAIMLCLGIAIWGAAKQRIGAMEVRYVLTPPSSMDALQAVLEIYVALELRARYNDFGTH